MRRARASFGLVTGAQFIETGKYKKVVVVGADKMSSIIDYTDRSTCIIFGDGGGAVLLTKTMRASALWTASCGRTEAAASTSWERQADPCARQASGPWKQKSISYSRARRCSSSP